MAILSSVSEATHVITAINTVQAENEPKRPMCFNSTGQRPYDRRNRVGGISMYHRCILMPNDLRNGVFCQRVQYLRLHTGRFMYYFKF